MGLAASGPSRHRSAAREPHLSAEHHYAAYRVVRSLAIYQMVLPMELVVAARVGTDAHFAHIKEYLDAGGDVNDVNDDEDTMLQLSVLFGGGGNAGDRLRIVKLLLARGADVDKSFRGGATPLFQACNCDDRAFGLGAIRCLLEAGANIDQKVLHGQLVETPLSTSLDWLRYDSVDWDETGLSYVSLLLRYGPDLDECWYDDKSAEDCLRSIENPDAFPELEGVYHALDPPPGASEKEQFLACKKLIADERGRRLKAKRKEVLRLRSLLVRGRAKKSSDAILEPSFRLPDGVLWNVLSFWPPQRPHLFLPVTTYRPASAYAGPRPGFVFATLGRRTGYWTSTYDGPRPGWEFTTRDGRTGYHPTWVVYRAVGIRPTLQTIPARKWPEPPWPPADWLTGALAPDYRGPGYLPRNRHLDSLRPRS